MTGARRPSAQTLAVLDALARRPGEWRHGYEMCLQLGLRAGTMHPILMRLADRGLLDTSWETAPAAGHPSRRLYRLSADGRVLAGAHVPVPRPARTVRPAAGPRPSAA